LYFNLGSLANNQFRQGKRQTENRSILQNKKQVTHKSLFGKNRKVVKRKIEKESHYKAIIIHLNCPQKKIGIKYYES
jgi:hypothetical protein